MLTDHIEARWRHFRVESSILQKNRFFWPTYNLAPQEMALRVLCEIHGFRSFLALWSWPAGEWSSRHSMKSTVFTLALLGASMAFLGATMAPPWSNNARPWGYLSPLESHLSPLEGYWSPLEGLLCPLGAPLARKWGHAGRRRANGAAPHRRAADPPPPCTTLGPGACRPGGYPRGPTRRTADYTIII